MEVQIERYNNFDVIWLPMKDGFFPTPKEVLLSIGYGVIRTPWHRIGENGLECAYIIKGYK